MKIIILIISQIFVFIARIIRNTLYAPYVTALILYLFFVFMSVSALFLSNDTGVNFINDVIKYILSLNLFDPNGSYNFTSTPEDTDKFIIYCITGFAIIYELITRIILSFKKDFDHKIFGDNILRITKIFYSITFIISSVIFILIFKQYAFFMILFLILLMNIVTLAFAYKITSIFSSITRIFDEINNSHFDRMN